MIGRNGIIASVVGSLVITQSVDPMGTTITFEGSLVCSNGGSAFNVVPETDCSFAPAVLGNAVAGSRSTCSLTNLNIPITRGTLCFWAMAVTSSFIPPVMHSIGVHATMSMVLE